MQAGEPKCRLVGGACRFGRRFSGWLDWGLWPAAFTICLGLFLAVVQADRAHAVSAGCTAVNGGALSQNAGLGFNVQNVPILTAAFETGETITWTITGNTPTVTININLGAALAVTDGTATFTIPASGTFRIDQVLQSSGLSASAITATCAGASTDDEAAVDALTNTGLSTELTQLEDLRRDLNLAADDARDAAAQNRLQREIEIQERLAKLNEQRIRAEEERIAKATAFIVSARITLRTLALAYRVTPGKKARLKVLRKYEAVAKLVARYQRSIAILKGKIVAAQAQIAQANAAETQARSDLETVSARRTARASGSARPFRAGFGHRGPAGSDTFGFNPLRFNLGGNSASFFTDLNTLRANAQREAQAGLAGDGIADISGKSDRLHVAPTRPNAWVRGSVVGFDADQSGAKRDGHAADLAAGAYYNPGDGFILGGLLRVRAAEARSSSQSSKLDTTGFGLGLHSTYLLTPEISASGFAFYEFSDNDIRTTGGKGTFDAEQLTLTGSLEGRFIEGPWTFEPTASITYAHVDRESYTNSGGTRVSGGTTERGQLSFGPRVRYLKRIDDGTVETISPYLAVNGVWNFIKADDTRLTNGAVIQGDEVLARLNGGLAVNLVNGMQLSLSGGYSGFGASKLDIYSLSSQVTIPFGGR